MTSPPSPTDRNTDDAFAPTEQVGDSPSPAPQARGRHAPDADSPGQRVGRYQLRERLGWTGTATVYVARDPELGRDVLLRAPGARNPIDTVALGTLAKLEQPGLGPVLDVEAGGSEPYLVTPLVSRTLMPMWLRTQRPGWRTVARGLLTVGTALVSAHAAGLTHASFTLDSVLIGDDEIAIADLERFELHPETIVRRDASAQSFAKAWLVAIEQTGAPSWLRAQLMRMTTSRDAAAELPSMLREVERRLARPKRLAATLVIGVVVSIAIVIGVVGRRERGTSNTCGDPASRLAGIWDAALRARTVAAFGAAGVPYASDTLTRMLPALDAYAAEWRSMHREACRATFVDKRQPSELFDRRMTCLDRRLGELRARTSVFADANPEVVRRASEVVANLPAIADCANVDALRAAQALPGSPAERARIEALFRAIDDARSAGLRGVPSDYLARATNVVERTSTETYLPLRVRALRLLVDAQVANKAPQESTYRELADVAARAQDDGAAALAWSRLVFMLAMQGRFEEAKTLGLAAETAVKRAGSPPAAVEQYESAMSVLAVNTGDWESATTHGRAAIEAAPTKIARRTALENLAMVRLMRGEIDEANRLVEQALAAVDETQGRHHPTYANTLLIYARVTQRSERPGDIERSLRAYEDALAIYRETLGENSDSVAETYVSFGELQRARRHTAEAEQAFGKAVAIYERNKNSAMLPTALKGLADATAEARGLAAARPLYDRAIRAAAESAGADSFEVAGIEANLAIELADHGACTSARTYAEHARQVFQKLQNGEGEAIVLALLSKCAFSGRDIQGGIEMLERAVAICGSGGCSPGNIHYMRRDLGVKLAESGRDRRRGIALVRAARDGFAEMSMADNVAEVDAWLKKHAR